MEEGKYDTKQTIIADLKKSGVTQNLKVISKLENLVNCFTCY